MSQHLPVLRMAIPRIAPDVGPRPQAEKTSRPCTESVDNFVKKSAGFDPEATSDAACDRSMTKQAAQKTLKSTLLPPRPRHAVMKMNEARNGAACGHI
jgi:hypothetical protein